MNDTIARKLSLLPDSPGCYLMKEQGKIIYVGKAVNLKNACGAIFMAATTPPRWRPWFRISKISISCSAAPTWKR